MSRRLVLALGALFCTTCGFAQSSRPETRAVVLQKNEGEVRTRRPRETPIPSSDFLLKISPRTNGSKHFLLGSEEIAPGVTIPKHRHHGKDGILLIDTGTAQVSLDDRQYEAHAGAVVFIPAGSWISLKNTGNQNIHLVFVFNEPGFEDMMICGSVAKGQEAPALSREEVKRCYEHGDAELE